MDQLVKADLFKGGVFLGCTFGIACTYIWAVGILASGQSSTMTGTYSGQFAMEGFLNLKWKRWQRVLLTRSIAMAPTFSLAYFSDINHLTGMNDILNALMSIQLPFAIIPTLTFTHSKLIMGEFANGLAMKITTTLLAIVVIVINIFFVVTYVGETVGGSYWLILVVFVAILYFIFVFYLAIFMFISLGFERLATFGLVQKLYRLEGYLDQSGAAIYRKESSSNAAAAKDSQQTER